MAAHTTPEPSWFLQLYALHASGPQGAHFSFSLHVLVPHFSRIGIELVNVKFCILIEGLDCSSSTYAYPVGKLKVYTWNLVSLENDQVCTHKRAY